MGKKTYNMDEVPTPGKAAAKKAAAAAAAPPPAAGGGAAAPPAATPAAPAPHVPYGTKVAWGATPLGREAIKHRARNGITGQQNVAVLQYRDSTGALQTIAFESGAPVSPQSQQLAQQIQAQTGGKEKGHGHSESKMLKFMELNGITAEQVVGVYSEREPCNDRGAMCAHGMAKAGIGADKVTYSFDYGKDEESKARGNKELADRLAAIDEEAWQGLREQTERDDRARQAKGD